MARSLSDRFSNMENLALTQKRNDAVSDKWGNEAARHRARLNGNGARLRSAAARHLSLLGAVRHPGGYLFLMFFDPGCGSFIVVHAVDIH
jgi:hypothetical protein